ncbi:MULTISPECIES: glycoside hydrolase family 3 N-terminal domain-containing protein [unclassified Paenibacillus]|uniref:glycoside hydrolase family 3 N-terminal domain-containing protein n=1 Tax=unclassified Paenibacillus TaxID=185978 RepID=UPI0009A6500E|nr:MULTISPECIES: glycoside hydrolase family 3 N-terminal domain-containing protein [unclassified Paenibacillus]SLK19522.1 beta-glucosidase [Paenibacillus sp. RU5A]SOC75827.1 beta-glucosidase [Paenibacillus sp. RU26A]SOC77678.1 beta-glucosidase [Paenibacillus sp. RU5M]
MDYKDASLPVQERTQDLLGRMTTEEKIGQLIQPMGWKTYVKEADSTVQVTDEFKKDIAEGGMGSLYGALRADPWTEVTLETGLTPRQGAVATNEIQRYAMENSRLGIPILFGEECSHGHMAIGATVFPVPLAVGSAWNTELYRKMCEAIAMETRSQGGAATYSPVLDVVRDPRWGRTEECFAEDPYLIGELAVEAIKGLQGDRLDSNRTIVATLKHFAAYGSSEGGRNAAPVHMGLRELHEVDLLPFKKAVEAGACSVMTAYNEIDGVPCTSSSYLLNDLLREQWGFDGFVITDFGAIQMLVNGHNTAENGEQAVAQSLKAGVDMEMSGYMYGKHLRQALSQGLIEEQDLDTAVRRVLEMKFRLGLFEQPFVDPDFAEQVIGCEEHIQLARKVAQEGIILLKNEDNTLPLGKTGTKLAVIGPNANHVYNQLGDYTSPQPRGQIVTVLDGITRKLGADTGKVLYAPGCRIKGDSREGFAQALACAEEADTIIMVMGGSSSRDFGEGTIDLRTGASVVTDDPWNDMECGEGIDRSSLNLMGVQLELVQEVHRLGKPVIVVYINGRPIAEPWIDEHAHAIVEAWYPGQEGGNAIADILFGDVNPSGRLTVSIPKHVGQLPVSYNAKRTRGKRYLETDLLPQYPFGFGLSYTEFKYENVRVVPEVIGPDDEAEVQVEVTNTGVVAGNEVVQLYITDVSASVTRAEISLKGFRKIHLEPGQTRTVTFPVQKEHLELIDSRLQPVVEPGEFKLMVGSSSRDWTACSLHIQKVGVEV